MDFDSLNRSGQAFAEATMGETFSYTPLGMVATLSGLKGVFNLVVQDYEFEDHSIRQRTAYTVVSGKVQWGVTVPADRGTITDSSGGTYQIESIGGKVSAGEPAYELTMKKLT